ncbi:LysM peptidoglycan-binding domain-containing protein [Fuchsiella alkaliacetigena]|uniref:LysM peptidoglycan-binding domain-containing protein n=1 Tax=Fuchsiella alkaliacetigena TaxID=957042 RepID=UPI00200A57EE|nr:LysM peptidoglycan-binding domain-containing protein [Fuchsiella alkaliacetigena]MCK8825361.1 LysM peptidoglycan-binding domain-containing protein [Fuchsiella alkaliacetigena]
MKKIILTVLALLTVFSLTMPGVQARSQEIEKEIHTVNSGESLWIIAQQYNTTVEELTRLNRLDSDVIYIGEEIIVPVEVSVESGPYYRVQPQDSLWKISQRYDATVAGLMKLNSITDYYNLEIGRRLLIDEAREEMEMYGEITEVNYNQEQTRIELMMENIFEDNKPYDKAVALISEETEILADQVEVDKFEVGQRVGVVFKEGPVAMIYPLRIGAEVIKII